MRPMKTALLAKLIIAVSVVLIAVGFARKGTVEQQPRIAVIPKGTSSPFWETVRKGAAKACEELGYEMSWIGPEVESDRERQIQTVEDFIARKVSGIVLAPNDSRALVPVTERVFRRKIPCVIIDSGIETDKYASFAATDNRQGGVIAAGRMNEILGGKGKVVVLRFMPGSGSTTNREEGFIDTIEEQYPGIEVVETKYGMATVETAIRAAEDLLTKHTELDGIFACNNHTTVGAAQALESQRRVGQVKVVGFDSEEALIEMLRKGTVDSLVVQNPFKMGYEGVKLVVATLEGKQVERRVDTGVELVTKDRLDEPAIKALLDLR